MAKKIIIGGGSGFMGRHLSQLLTTNGYEPIVVSRDPDKGHITWNDLETNGLPEDCEGVVNVAGENLLSFTHRWNDEFKATVRESRVATTSQLVRAIHASRLKPKVYVAITGVAYYPPSETQEYTEESDGGDYDFLSRLVSQWEAASESLNNVGVRRVVIRSGVVLGRDGGMIKQIYLPFFLGLGGRIGSGTQWFPWIHIEDIAGIVTHAIINDETTGVLNGTAPGCCTNAQFTRAFTRSLWRPAVFPVPSFVMSTLLGSERAKAVLEGQKVVPKRTLECGYKFLYPTISEACMAL